MTSSRFSAILSIIVLPAVLLSASQARADSIILKNGSNIECIILIRAKEYTRALSPKGLTRLSAVAITRIARKKFSKGFIQSMQQAYGPAWENHAKWQKTRFTIQERKRARDAKELVRRPEFILASVFGKAKIPAALDREKLLEVCLIMLGISSPADAAPGRRIEIDENLSRKTAVKLEELKIKPLGYVEFFYGKLPLSPMLVKMDSTGRKKLMDLFRSATLSIYTFLPGKETSELMKKIVNGKHVKNSHKEQALDVLINTDLDEAINVLLKSLTSAGNRFRGIVAAKIAGIQERQPEEKLAAPIMEMLNDPSTPSEAKPYIVRLLVSFKDPKIIKRVTESIYLLDTASITEIIRLLGGFADEETMSFSVPFLIRYLKLPINADQQRWAALTLGQLGAWDALPPLIEALEDRNNTVSNAAWNALRNITRKRFAKNHTIWKEWFKTEGIKGKPTISEKPVTTARAGNAEDDYWPKNSIRPTIVGRRGQTRAEGEPSRAAAAAAAPVSRKRNIIMISLVGIAALSVIFLILFFRKGTAVKPKKA